MCLLAQLGDPTFEARKEGVRDDERFTDLLSENARLGKEKKKWKTQQMTLYTEICATVPVTLQLGGSVRLQTAHGHKPAQLGDMPFGRALGHRSTGQLTDLDHGE